MYEVYVQHELLMLAMSRPISVYIIIEIIINIVTRSKNVSVYCGGIELLKTAHKAHANAQQPKEQLAP